MMDETISLEDLKENFEEVIERVDDGEIFAITIDGKVRAVLVPYEEYKEMVDELNSLVDPDV